MAKTEFDKELSTYLTRRKKAATTDLVKWVKSLFPKPTPPAVQVKLPEEVQTYEEKPGITQKKLEKTGAQIEEYQDDKKNILTFILEKLSFGSKPKLTEEEQAEKIKNIVSQEMAQKDLREVSKIALMAIKKLPDEDRKEFKESSEFDSLKKILKKHDLIK